MDVDPVNLLKLHKDDTKLGAIAREALRFIEPLDVKILQSPGLGQRSSAFVRMYEVRMGLNNFKQDAFIGLKETIKYLSERDIAVHLSVIETESGVISVWIADESGAPVGIVIAKYVGQE